MNTMDISEDKLNMFIDGEMDSEEMNEIHKALLDDKVLRERVCQLKAVRELVGYAYSEVHSVNDQGVECKRSNSLLFKAMAASITLLVGVLLGWSTYEYSPNAVNAISAENTFQYVANHVTADSRQRKIILHIDSSDLKVVEAALNEADYLLATYRKANKPLKLDIITNKTGIDILRPAISPYINRIQKLVDEEGVTLFACVRSINKAHKREGGEVVLMKGVHAGKTAKEIIPARLEKGWVYIKA
jgi:intracellular sulfur oxidation DsrE/DsrF family protein